jgi:hypothetical protein
MGIILSFPKPRHVVVYRDIGRQAEIMRAAYEICINHFPSPKIGELFRCKKVTPKASPGGAMK